ncbi:hypothetical protein K504DRAFT_490563, partial [Pleomassaria siparia CBS 279.74]
MATSKPTIVIVIVHGSYHTPAPYGSLSKALETHGHSTHCPQLPGALLQNLVSDASNPDFDAAAPPPSGYPAQSDDADTIKSLLKTLVEEQGKKVLLVAHSSGGWSASEAAVPDLQRDVRSKEGKEGGVIGVFYMTALLVARGESTSATFGQIAIVPAWVDWHKSGLSTILEPERYFFHDLDPSEAEKWSATLTACTSLDSKLTNDPYAALPLAYLICEGDRVVPAAYQESLVKATEEKSGKKIEVYRCRGGHDAFLSSTKWV